MMPNLLLLGVLWQLAASPAAPAPSGEPPRRTLPVLAFPEPGIDDPAAYQGYRTRLYRDSRGNTVQVYLEPRSARVVLLWADAANESVGFTVRDVAGRPAPLDWGAEAATIADSGTLRTIEYDLTIGAPRAQVGWLLLGSMRVERDFQYAGLHRRPFTAPPYQVAEESLLVANLARLPNAERRRHLALLDARSVAELRERLHPTLASSVSDTMWAVTIAKRSLDGRNRLTLELRGRPRDTRARVTGRTVSVEAPAGAPIRLRMRVTTDAPPLTPLPRDAIFNRAFLDFLAGARAAHDSVLRRSAGAGWGTDSATIVRYRRLERDVRGVELLSAKEKLMAGLPNFATYFGRDMLVTALMMRPIWAPGMAEHVLAGVLRKLGPGGEVSHEEALGGQAIRENAAEYNALLTEYFKLAAQGSGESAKNGASDGSAERRGSRPDSLLARAREVLRDLQRVRENYHMIDDEFQLPVLAARYLADTAVAPADKQAFLLDTVPGGAPHLRLLLRELALVAKLSAPYVRAPSPTKLVGFPKLDTVRWRSASWRDSDAGYGGGRFAMDVNAIWVPQALEAIATIRAALQGLGISRAALDSIAPEIAGTALAEYLADSTTLARAIATWRGARRHFVVTLAPDEVRERVRAKLAWLPGAERRFWEAALASARNGDSLASPNGDAPAFSEAGDSLAFLALALDADGRPIPIVNTDPATELLLRDFTAEILCGTAAPDAVLRALGALMRPYPVGLLVDGLGPVVANDAYATRAVWERFRSDPYHSPRVVWGREVNLLLLGLARQIGAAFDASGRLIEPSLAPYVRALRGALERTRAAVKASRLEHSELRSYRIERGRLVPSRYGTGSDVQLWSSTNLAVQFVLSRLPAP